ncbi:MAG: hypothetical protein MUE44_05690 [Oscillatoriaceae cyanobacterium Prado104]|nr:hypothetical protein [Oscillatoriaceae cyanobacterium Prado104]
MFEPIDFQPYLRSICEKYDKWNRIYTPIDAEHQRAPCRDKKFDRSIDLGKIDDRILQCVGARAVSPGLSSNFGLSWMVETWLLFYNEVNICKVSAFRALGVD